MIKLSSLLKEDDPTVDINKVPGYIVKHDIEPLAKSLGIQPRAIIGYTHKNGLRGDNYTYYKFDLALVKAQDVLTKMKKINKSAQIVHADQTGHPKFFVIQIKGPDSSD